jgi:hypothetical protein
MRTRNIRLDAGQSHISWFDKGSQVIVLDGVLAVTLRHGGLDWLPDAPHHIRYDSRRRRMPDRRHRRPRDAVRSASKRSARRDRRA